MVVFTLQYTKEEKLIKKNVFEFVSGGIYKIKLFFFFYKILESPKTNKFGLISIPHIKLHFQISNTYVKSLTDLTGKKYKAP